MPCVCFVNGGLELNYDLKVLYGYTPHIHNVYCIRFKRLWEGATRECKERVPWSILNFLLLLPTAARGVDCHFGRHGKISFLQGFDYIN